MLSLLALRRARDSTIDLDQLPPELSHAGREVGTLEGVSEPASSILANAERQAIEDVLKRHDGNRAAACQELGMSRSTLWRKMRKLGIGK